MWVSINIFKGNVTSSEADHEVSTIDDGSLEGSSQDYVTEDLQVK